MNAVADTAVVTELRAKVSDLERENADLKRQVVELREAVAALLRPDGPDFASQMRHFG
jgi:hypothetical protein